MKDKFKSILSSKRVISEIRLDSHDEKEVIWYPENLKDEIKRNWTNEMRREIGFQLGRVQQGLDPDHFREMPSIAVSVREIKIQDENKSQYRLIYVAKFEEGIYTFHAIAKKTAEKQENWIFK
jgi:phage-related protein